MDFSTAKILHVVTHQVGNKLRAENNKLSSKYNDIGEEILPNLLMYFLSQFRNTGYYRFHNVVDLSHNEVYQVITRIFQEGDLIENSKLLAKLLYESSTHPKIKAGEFHVVLFENIYIEKDCLKAIGIYKSEITEEFLKFNSIADYYNVSNETGFSYDSLDKGCLIFNTDQSDGYKIAIIDKASKIDAQYWIDDFLQITARADEYHHTTDYLAATKDFIVKQIPQEYDVTKAQQADYLNRSITYFKNNAEFDEQSFVQEVFEDKELINSFTGYKKEYAQEREIELSSDFYISGTAVKKTARVFKSVIKLDKNFHVYVHGDRDMIEKGYDEAVGKHYYKIYFDQES